MCREDEIWLFKEAYQVKLSFIVILLYVGTYSGPKRRAS